MLLISVQESENDVAKDESSIQPIRESSTEQENFHPEVRHEELMMAHMRFEGNITLLSVTLNEVINSYYFIDLTCCTVQT